MLGEFFRSQTRRPANECPPAVSQANRSDFSASFRREARNKMNAQGSVVQYRRGNGSDSRWWGIGHGKSSPEPTVSGGFVDDTAVMSTKWILTLMFPFCETTSGSTFRYASVRRLASGCLSWAWFKLCVSICEWQTTTTIHQLRPADPNRKDEMKWIKFIAATSPGVDRSLLCNNYSARNHRHTSQRERA